MIKVFSDSVFDFTLSKLNKSYKIHLYIISNDSIFTADYIKQFFYTDIRLYDFAILSSTRNKTIFLLQTQNIDIAQEILHNLF